ncbi:MAG: radical SAM protein [Lactobacillales bacterium]|nr:radical SAM protein [Lactobacillales bacterium]
MQKNCPLHGPFDFLIARDAKRFWDKSFYTPGKSFHPISKCMEEECVGACGWCDQHEQHICTGLIEITDHCNLNCPICYFGPKRNAPISLKDFEERLNALFKIEGDKLDVLQISGGECLTHPKLCDFIDMALSKNIGRILINTNGLALLDNNKIFQKIKDNKDRVEIYLQFDGFDEKVDHALRGTSLVLKKIQVIDKLNENAIKIGLAVTVYNENLKEIPKILEFGCRMKHISGITFQRMAKFGCAKNTKLTTVLHEDLLLAIASSGMIKYKDLIPLPCSHLNCTSLGFLFVTPEKTYNLGDYINFSKCKDAISNRIAFDETVLEYLGQNVCDCFVGKILGSKFDLNKLQSFIKNKSSLYQDMKVLRIVVKNFMDAETFDFKRAKRCCIGVAIGPNRVVPFCVHNNLKDNCQHERKIR